MSGCPSCGGIIGRDCWNPQECAEITARMGWEAVTEPEAQPPGDGFQLSSEEREAVERLTVQFASDGYGFASSFRETAADVRALLRVASRLSRNPGSVSGIGRHLVDVFFPNGMALSIVREDDCDAVTIWSEDGDSIFTQAAVPHLAALSRKERES